MPLLPSLVEILAGIVVLFVGGELFVAGATVLALLLGIPQIVVGLTVVSLGTSATALAASNVVGSNLPNLLLILVMCALATGPAGLPVGVIPLVLVFLVWQELAWMRVRLRLPG